MSIVDFFRKKTQKEETQQPSARDVYQVKVEALFKSYLVNSYSHHVSNGGQTLTNEFTTYAKSQPLTFYQYCQNIANGIDVTSMGAFNVEQFQLKGAQTILTDQKLNQEHLLNCCNTVSTVYECALATSNSSMQKLQDCGKDPSNAQLDKYGLESLKEHYQGSPNVAFTSKSFDRNGVSTIEVPEKGGARAEIANLENFNPDAVPWALDLMILQTADCQRLMATQHSDFLNTTNLTQNTVQ